MIAALLLAAGESTRMGQLKALLPWQGTSLLEFQLRQIRASRVDEIIVVLGHRAGDLEPIAAGPRTRIVQNPDYHAGKTSSIRAGVAALDPTAEAVLILGVDQPRPTWLLNRLIAAHQVHPAPITSPAFQGRRGGHPPIFARALFPEVLTTSEERAGLRELFNRHECDVQLVPIDNPIVRVNLNTWENYEAAQAMEGWTAPSE